jgi:arylsulfatase A-like enzyme
MSISERAKDFLRTWVVPPGLLQAHRRRAHLAQFPDLETVPKLWRGTPVQAPAAETAYFAAVGLTAETVTRQDDSRACARVTGNTLLPLPPGAGESGACQFAVLAERHWFADDRVRVLVGGVETAQSHLSPGAWLDLRVPVPPDGGVIEIDTPAPLLVTMPRVVRVRPAPAEGVRHVVVLVLDAWSMRMFADEHPTEPGLPLTPNVERFFRGGLSSSHAFSTSEWTMPAVASFMTGVSTLRHGMFHPTASCQLPADRVTLAEHFQRGGFHTQAFTTANRITPIYGHHRGFDRFVYHWPRPDHTERGYDPAVWLNDLVGHLDVHQHDRTFTYMHLPDTHPAWSVPPQTRSFNLQRRGSSTGLDLEALDKAPSPLAAAQGTQLYLLRLHELDRMFSGLFDFIERHLAGNAVVVLTADHGTPWHHLRRAWPADEPYLVDDRTTILFKMRGPGVPVGELDTMTAPNLDLMPTLLTLAGLPVPGDLDGRDLTDRSYARDHIVSESVFKGVYEVAVRDGHRAYFEKYPFDEATSAITGPPHYHRLFAAGTLDYVSPLDEPPGRLKDLAHAHIRRLGLLRDGAS